jgi:hypothetical protein
VLFKHIYRNSDLCNMVSDIGTAFNGIFVPLQTENEVTLGIHNLY